MKTIIYHHGYSASDAVKEAIKAALVKVPCRNADYFLPADVEKTENVVVDEGKNTAAIRAAYEKAGANVLTVDEFLEGLGKKAEPKAAEPVKKLDADAPRANTRQPRAQGATKKAEPKAAEPVTEPAKAQ